MSTSRLLKKGEAEIEGRSAGGASPGSGCNLTGVRLLKKEPLQRRIPSE